MDSFLGAGQHKPSRLSHNNTTSSRYKSAVDTSGVGEQKTQDRHFLTYDVGIALWLNEHWGIAGRHVRAPGDDMWDSPVETTDRIFSGQGNLQYTTVTARRR